MNNGYLSKMKHNQNIYKYYPVIGNTLRTIVSKTRPNNGRPNERVVGNNLQIKQPMY